VVVVCWFKNEKGKACGIRIGKEEKIKDGRQSVVPTSRSCVYAEVSIWPLAHGPTLTPSSLSPF